MENQTLNASVTLKLNTNVLNALFPEGTEARVQLQHAVLAEAAKTFIKGQLDDNTRKFLETVVNDLAKKVDYEGLIGQLFAKKNHWRSDLVVKPDSSVAVAIAERIREHLNAQMDEIIEREVAARLPKAIEGIAERVQQLVDQKVRVMTHQMLVQKVNTAFEAAGFQPLKQA